jgi:hypothetical protein
MELRDDYGLVVAVTDAAGALRRCGDGDLPAAAVLRVPDPPPDSWPELTRAGFVRKPDWLTWSAGTPAADDEYLSGLTRKSRQDVVRAVRHADAAGVRFETRKPLDAATLDTFLGLYRRQVDQMAYGFPFADRLRDSLLTGEHDFAVYAFAGDRLIGGCLCLEAPADQAVRLRFSAVTDEWRAVSLARVLYLGAFRAARERGYPRVTLGNDPNLYGHVAKPGLYLFKSRLGFDAAPAGRLAPAMAGDSADLVLSLDRLTDPAVILGYPDAGAGDDPGLVAHVHSAAPDDTVAARYRTRFAPRVRSVTVPAAGRRCAVT